MRSVHGKVAVVTGAASGMGRAIAELFAAEGATVAALDIDGDACPGPNAWTLDVADAGAVTAVVDEVAQRLGPVDVLVNNAGISLPAPIGADDYWRAWDTTISVNLTGYVRMVRACLAGLTREPGGRIVNIASMAGLRVLGQLGVYSMSKAAVIHMTRAMALEWGRYGINTNALCPGYIDTEINHHYWQTEGGQKLMQMMPRRRVGAPQDLDAALMMLCANESHFVNGAVLAADDGFGLS